MRKVSEGVFWPNHVPDPTSNDYDTVPDSGNELCMEVHGTEKWVRDYKNGEENNEQTVGGVAIEQTDDDDTKIEEDPALGWCQMRSQPKTPSTILQREEDGVRPQRGKQAAHYGPGARGNHQGNYRNVHAAIDTSHK